MILGVSGHRPDKLFKDNPYSRDNEIKLIAFAKSQLELISPKEVISGVALGWDQAIASACVLLNIPFIAACPFRNQKSNWPKASQDKYCKLLGYAKEIKIISDGEYAAYKLQIRNEWIVNNSDKMLALYDGSQGGTANCVQYAIKQNKEVINCWDEWAKYGQ